MVHCTKAGNTQKKTVKKQKKGDIVHNEGVPSGVGKSYRVGGEPLPYCGGGG